MLTTQPPNPDFFHFELWVSRVTWTRHFCECSLNRTNICSTGRDSVIQKFFFFWTDLPPSNHFDFLWSCHFYLAYHRRKEGKKYQHLSISSYLIEYTFSAYLLYYSRTWRLFYVFPSLWQATIRDLSRLIPISCKRRRMKFSRSFGATELSYSENLRHLIKSCLCYKHIFLQLGGQIARSNS